MGFKVLLVDDEITSLAIMKKMLSGEGYDVNTANNGEEALSKANLMKYDIVITDFNMPGISGIELTKELLNLDPETIILLITAYASIKGSVEAIKVGAFDYLTKPVNREELLLSVQRACDKINILKENQLLKNKLILTNDESNKETEYLTNNDKVKSLLSEAKAAAASDSAILITGSNGTGKEVLAKYIFNNSKRKEQPFIVINCAAIPEQLLESELFGHIRGSFTGAIKDKKGYFEIADSGTIFLDEIGEITPQIQVKLLRVLQEKEFSKVGDTKIQQTNVRIIAATNRNLTKQIETGKFREDLLYRLNVFEFHLPSLKNRPEDILFYFEMFVEQYSVMYDKRIKKIDQNVKDILLKYSWPGNIRELKNIAERVTILCEGNTISSDLLPSKFVYNHKILIESADYNTNKENIIKNFEVNFIMKYLKLYKGNVAATARAINFHPVSLRQKLAKLGIEPELVKFN